MPNFRQDYPILANPLVDPTTGIVTPTWHFFLLNLFNRTGGTIGNNSSSFLYPATAGATGQFLTSQGNGLSTIWTTPATKLSQLTNDSGFITGASLDGYAPLNSPAFTGTPTAPTPFNNDSSTKIATTEFVSQNALTLVSPTFTGVPAAPTPALNNNTTQLATTGFVIAQESNGIPLAAGIGASGTALTISRSDHRHPTEIAGAPTTNPGNIRFSNGLQMAFGSTVIQLNSSGFGSVVFGFTFSHACTTFVCSNGDDTQLNGPVHSYGVATTTSANVFCPNAVPSSNYRVNWTCLGW